VSVERREAAGRMEVEILPAPTRRPQNPPFLQVNAIVGGVLANEVLKAVSGREEPLDNMFMYSMADGAGIVERLAPTHKETHSMSALASRLDHKNAPIRL
jgi:hypothetical protein